MNTDTTGSGARRRIRIVVAAVVATLAVGASAGTAQAAPFERGHFHDVGDELLEDFCGDVDFFHTWDVSGSFTGVARGRDGLIYFRDSVRGTETFTNLDTDRTVTIRFATSTRDRQVTDNGDGTLTIVVQGSGGWRLYDGDGKLQLRDPGMIRWSFVVDHGGTPTDPSDDEFVEDLGIVKPSTGRNDTEGRDFCEDLVSVIGP